MIKELACIIEMLETPGSTIVGHIIFWVFNYIDEADEDLGFYQYLKQTHKMLDEEAQNVRLQG